MQKAAERAGSPRSTVRAATLGVLLGNVWRVFIWTVALLIVLETAGLNLTPLLASATVIGATLGFGAQIFVRDFLTGIFLMAEDQYGIGDTITIGERVGTVEDLTLRVTRLRAPDGTLWYVPNGEIRQLANNTRSTHP
jgi:small conductance mechanosensitive channel